MCCLSSVATVGVKKLQLMLMLLTEAAAADGVRTGNLQKRMRACVQATWVSCSVRYSVQQVPRIIEAAAVEVGSRCTAHKEIVFLWGRGGRGEEIEGKCRQLSS